MWQKGFFLAAVISKEDHHSRITTAHPIQRCGQGRMYGALTEHWLCFRKAQLCTMKEPQKIFFLLFFQRFGYELRNRTFGGFTGKRFLSFWGGKRAARWKLNSCVLHMECSQILRAQIGTQRAHTAHTFVEHFPYHSFAAGYYRFKDLDRVCIKSTHPNYTHCMSTASARIEIHRTC